SRIAVPLFRPATRYGRTAFRVTKPLSFWNVFVAVFARCAVHSTVRSGNIVQSATTARDTKNVFATCRGIENVTPPTVAANSPSSRRPNVACPRPSCHTSNATPNSAQRSSMSNHSVSTIPSGITTCRATSDSRSVERAASALSAVVPTAARILLLSIRRTDQPIQLAEFLVRRRDRVRRHLARIQLPRQLQPHRRQHVPARGTQRLRDRLRHLPRRRRVRIHDSQVVTLARAHGTTP